MQHTTSKYKSTSTRSVLSTSWAKAVLLATLPLVLTPLATAQANVHDVALQSNGGVASASSYGTYQGDPQLPWKANDGDALTGWSSNSEIPAWFKVEFAAVSQIESVGILWGSHIHNYTVELSLDDANWVSVLGGVSSNCEGCQPEYEHFQIAPTSAKFIRINLLSTSAPASHIFQASVQDLKAYTASPPSPPFSDGFSDGIIDPLLWGTMRPYSDSEVVETGGALELSNRGILHTLDAYDPAILGDVKIRCEWKESFACGTCGVDAYYLVSRSDLSQNGCCGQLATGVNLHLSGTANTLNLLIVKDQVALSPTSAAPFFAPPGAGIGMELIDSTNMIVGRVWELGNPSNFAVVSLPGYAGTALGDRVGFFNRESVAGDKLAKLDNVRIKLVDCNSNGIPDSQDVMSGGASSDCNQNGIPDECDIASGASQDSQGNGTPDECECLSNPYCIATANSTGIEARMGYNGSLSIAANNLRLNAYRCPSNKPALFFFGFNETQTPLGNGFRCIGGQTFRLPVVSTGVNGRPSYLIDYNQHPFGIGGVSVASGTTLKFQCWFRDPGVGAGFNLSNGLSVTLCP